MKYCFSFFVLFLAFSIPGVSQPTPSEFLQDIEQLQSLIRNKHARPFWQTSERDFESVIASAKTTIKTKQTCDASCYVELLKIVASIQDGHSVVSGSSRYEIFGYLPFSGRWFDGELRILRTAEKYSDILGAKVEKVDGMPIETVLDKLRIVLPHANASRFKKFAGSYLHLPGLLYGLGITENPGRAVFTFNRDGLSFEKELLDMPPDEEENTTFVSFLDQKEELPWFQRDNDLSYWFDYDPIQKVVYFQYNRINSMKTESSRDFAKRMWSVVDSVEVDKFIMDLRYNGGGSFPYSLTFVQGLLDRLDINKRGRLFVISGFDTFSAATSTLLQMELKSEAIVLGEVHGDYRGRPGDAEKHTLDNTGLIVYLSSLYHPELLPGNDSNSIKLDKTIPTPWENYKNGEDPIVNYILKESNWERTRVTSEDKEDHLGTYSFSSMRDLVLSEQDGTLHIEISRSLFSPLYAIEGEENRFNTEVEGLDVSLSENGITLHFPDGKSKTYNRKPGQQMSPIDILYAGDFENARPVLEELKQQNPDLVELQDHQMSFLASVAYFELRKYPDVDAAAIARGILNLGIDLNSGDAPFCEFSLRFYQ